MLRHDYHGQHCSIASSLEVIGERWSLLIIRDILLGKRRFGEIQESLGIARNVLTTRLRRLVDAGLIEPRPYQERPLRNEYFLTEKGLDLWPVLVSLIHWGDKHFPRPGGPPIVLIHRDCGGEIDSHRICTRCGKPLAVRDAVAISGDERNAPAPGASSSAASASPSAAA